MKRLAVAATLASCLLLVSPARGALDFGVGAYGVYQWPIAQDDAEAGGLFGLKAKVGLIPLLDIEPNISWVLNGDAETNSGGTIKAPEVIAYQLNANLRLGGIFQLTGGLGWASVDVPSAGSSNEFAGNFGFAVEVPAGPLTVDVSPRILVINTASGASRKHALLMAGLNYRF